MATPQNRVPVRIARGTIADLTASLADLYEGEVCFATDEDKLYVKEGGVLVTPSTGEITSIGDIPDVDLSLAPSTGDFLSYNGASWVPAEDTKVDSITTGITGATVVNNIVAISQTYYDALGSYDANTIYFITP